MLKWPSHQINIENAMHKALRDNELELYYQPKISLKTGKMTRVKALIRWHDPSDILRASGYFIPIAEQSDLIIEIYDWGLTTVFKDIVRNANPIRTSLNLSARQFSASYNLIEQLNQWLAKFGVNSKYI